MKQLTVLTSSPERAFGTTEAKPSRFFAAVDIALVMSADY
jgi:hypothetical protein